MEQMPKKKTISKRARHVSLFKVLSEAVENYEEQVGVKVEQVIFNRNSPRQENKITSMFLKTA